MDLFKFFRFKKTKPDTNQLEPETQSEEAKVEADAPAPEQSSAELPAALPAAVPAAQAAQPAKKAIAISALKDPSNVSELATFLGMTNFYSEYVPN